MIKYLKNEVKHLPLILVLCIILYVIVRIVTNSWFQSKSSLTNSKETNLGDAVSSAYACVSNFSTYNQRLTAVENKFGNSSLTTTAETITESINEVNSRFNSSSAVPVTSGGIGTTTAAGAREVLDAPSTGDIPIITMTSVSGDDENGVSAWASKYGNVVSMSMTGALTSDLAAKATIVTLPEGYRPPMNIEFVMSSNQNGNVNTQIIRGWVNSSGAVTSNVALTSGKQVVGSITYIVEDPAPETE